MPRLIQPTATLDIIEDEVMYTTAALGADPDAADLSEGFSIWLTEADTERARERAIRQQELLNIARRVIANGRIDAICTRFGDDLYLASGKDRKSRRWLTFFNQPVSTFVRQPFADQIGVVGGWLTSDEPALAPHRDSLTTWHAAAKQALDAEGPIRIAQSEQRQRREDLASRLTTARDELHDQLSTRARERGLDRNWADSFFLRS